MTNREHDAKVLYQRAAALAGQGRLQEAIDAYQESLTIVTGLGERQMVTERHFDAGSIGSALVSRLQRAGKFREALNLVEQLEEYTTRSGFGRWTQLADRAQRLRLLHLMGHDEEVLAEVERLREEMAALPETSDQPEQALPGQVREAILQAGAVAASGLQRWELALALNDEAARSVTARGASALEIAKIRYNDHIPLLHLGQLDEARKLLLACRSVFEAEGDIVRMGDVLGALASLEDELGNVAQALSFEQTALRYSYVGMDPEGAAVGHFNLAYRLLRARKDPSAVLAHRLAAVILVHQSGSGRLNDGLRILADNLERLGGDRAPVPTSFAALCERVERVKGVRFAELIARLSGTPTGGDQVLAEVLRLVRWRS